jgi:hypothetical protein
LIFFFFFFFLAVTELKLMLCLTQAMRKFALLMAVQSGEGNVRRHIFLDNCRIHDSPKLALEMLAHNIVLWYLPKNTSHFSQPLDVFVIATIKMMHRSSFRQAAEAAARSNVPLDPSATIGFLIEAIIDPRLRQATQKSFLKTDIVGVRFDAASAIENFKSRAMGDMRASGVKRAPHDKPRVQLVSSLVNNTLSVLEHVQCADGAKVAAINNQLVPTVPMRKGSFCNAFEVAESTRAVASEELNKRIAEQSIAIDKARLALETAQRRCRACNTMKTVTAIEAKWLQCACGEYVVCVRCAERAPPMQAAAQRLSHCVNGAAVIADSDEIQTSRVKLNDALLQLEQYKRELEAVANVGHTPTGKRTRATEKARASKLTGRGIHSMLGLLDTIVDPTKVRAHIVVARSAVPTAAELRVAAKAVKRAAPDPVPDANPVEKASAAKRKRAPAAQAVAREADDDRDEASESGDGVRDVLDSSVDDDDDADDIPDVVAAPPPPVGRLSRRANSASVGDPVVDAMRNAVGRSARSVPIVAPWRAPKNSDQ